MPTRAPRLVVVGNGMVAAAFLEELVVRRPGGFDITVFGDEPHPAYDRIRLSGVLASEVDLGALVLLDREWYARHGIALRAGVRVTAIDRRLQVVHAADGSTTPYDLLVLATGSDPIVPPLEGLPRRGVHTFRTIDDAAAILAHAHHSERAVVIGGGLLGLEAAGGLRRRGLEVTVVHLVDRLMERQLDGPAGRLLRRQVEDLGVRVLLPAETAAVLGTDQVEAVQLRDGTTLESDLVVVACGVRPAVELARGAGLDVHRGIVIDDHLATSDPSIFAIGECTEHRGTVYGIVAPLRLQARTLAARFGGDELARFSGGVNATTLKVAGIDVFSAGEVDAEVDDDVLTFEDTSAGIYKRIVLREGRLRGAVFLGDLQSAPKVTALMTSRQPVNGERHALVAPPSRVEIADAADGLPDEAVVCGCNGVTKATIVTAIVEGGCRSRTEVTRCTKAAGSCGSCGSVVDQLLRRHAADGAATDRPARVPVCACVPLTRVELREAVVERDLRSVSEVLAELGNGVGCARCKPALAYYLDVIWCGEHREERHARFINDRVHANIQRDGTFSVVPRMYGGVTSPTELRRIADVAERFGVRMVKITGGQRIDLLGVSKETLPKIWEALGMPSGHAYAKAVRTVKTCVGSDFCRFGLGDSTALGIALEKAMWGLYTPHKVKCAVSGCPRNCAEITVKDIGIVAIATGWEVYVGGAAGMHVRKGDLLATVGNAEAALRSALLFLQHYREEADYLERTYAYLERVGIDRVRAATVEAPAEQQEALLERFRRARANVRDPWLERESPRTPAQFATLIPVAAGSA